MTFVAQSIQGRMMGQYMIAIGGDSPNRIKVFDIETKEVGTYTIKDNVVSMPTLTTTFTIDYRFNPNGTSLAVLHSNSPYLNIYNKIGNTYTLISGFNPGGNRTYGKCAWHPGKPLLAAGRYGQNNTTGQFQLWERIGDTFRNTGTFDVAITATLQTNCLAWNPQGTTLAMGFEQSPFFLIYNFNPETYAFTKITTPTSAPPTAKLSGIGWNDDGSSLAFSTYQASNQIQIYNRTGDTFVRCFTGNIGNNCSDISWGNANHIAFGIEASPRIGWFYRPPGTTSTFHRAANPASLPANNSTGLAISPDGLFAATGVYLNAAKYYRRDPATTSTWIDIGQNITGNPVYAKSPHVFPGVLR